MKEKLNWFFIIGLAALALVRPLMSMLGWLESIGQPTASISVTIVITLTWIAIAVLGRVDEPLINLTFTGVTYGVFAIVISAILSPILEGQLKGPITNPFAIVSVLVTNGIWGLCAGLIATVIQNKLKI
ncbi:hypothetical protein ACFQI7_36195 [Paenibacillus allorhizosphaerae]|uniref:Phage holin family protein n=1 Tax=Paenibacillus allorhizosphaerae TaxID=2849866 RepID=A0ABN7TWN4_9BACL|nr:hypothetical protein [Paenibacillus allorhizosphaerae]CAG7658711.1 hypothetical protein PAECIP111802_07139 [Paenibacillus allorhizosphaerae]